MRVVHAIALCGLLSACQDAESPGWRLVGFYDATTLLSRADPSGASAKRVSWATTPAMDASCGVAGAPLGLGVPDAIAMSSRLTPTLAVLLSRDADGQEARLSRDDLRLKLDQGEGAEAIRLEPAVLPYALQVSVDGGADDRQDLGDWVKSAVTQQLATSLCLEHKIGRAWTGGDSVQVSQALLLDERGAELSPTLFFIGSGAPIPALLGPETACLRGHDGPSRGRPDGLDASVQLEPGDVWNAALPPCDGDAPPPAVPDMSVYFGEVSLTASLDRAWSTLAVTVTGDTLSYRLNGQSKVLSSQILTRRGTFGAEASIPDVVGNLPRYYPTLSHLRSSGMETGEGGKTFALLIVPAWQLRALTTDPGADPGAADRDVVGEVLIAPQTLSVVVQEAGRWWEINPYRINPALTPLSWGYPLGGDVVEGPVAAVGWQPLSGVESSDAYRAPVQGFMAAAFITLGLLLLGALRRVSDLWRKPPELRLESWVERPPPGDAP